MINWINHRFGINLNANDLESIKDFSLIWNIFERFVCQNNFSIQGVEQAIATKNINRAEFQPQLEYFRNRYISNGMVNLKFHNLHLRANDRSAFVESVLKGNANADLEVILGMVIIVYRYRNNLFHGIKDIQVIDQQKGNFDNANIFLKSLLAYF
ncbi:hypothetical protein [Pedobacter gandavensis]|uniref:hypothetical protein n=1 Tax=Pedobacter gandavensis TaxID=2679963 RepID=UPI00292E9D01|nr:hypothetical protein [Pedobacter gandavensis]